jgi:hypothetical protein
MGGKWACDDESLHVFGDVVDVMSSEVLEEVLEVGEVVRICRVKSLGLGLASCVALWSLE